jgi:hypothetical protein
LTPSTKRLLQHYRGMSRHHLLRFRFFLSVPLGIAILPSCVAAHNRDIRPVLPNCFSFRFGSLVFGSGWVYVGSPNSIEP